MRVTLDQVLMLVGHLDDSPGFDTSCRRFRRFILEHITDVSAARAFIDQGERPHGEDQRRALQDLIVLLGRFLGFETRFGSYEPLDGVLTCDGHWRSRRLDIVLDIRGERTSPSDVSRLSRSVAALAATSRLPQAYGGGPFSPDWQVLGLCVQTSHRTNPGMHEQVVADARAAGTLRLVSHRTLLRLAEMVARGTLTQEEVVRLLDSSVLLDGVVDLLERPSLPAPAACPSADDRGPQYWFATVVAAGEDPRHIAESIVSGSGHLSVDTAAAPGHLIRANDWICLCIPGTGVVGHGQVASSTQQPGDGPERVTQVCLLPQTDVYIDSPVVPDFQTQLRLTAAHSAVNPATPALLSISREEFRTLTPRGEERTWPGRLAARAQSR
jgi:hypothetical protein